MLMFLIPFRIPVSPAPHGRGRRQPNLYVWNRWQFQGKPHQSLLTIIIIKKLFAIFAIINLTLSSDEH